MVLKSFLPKITDKSLIPASDLKNHFRNLILKSWDVYRENQHGNKLRHMEKIPRLWIFSNRDSRREEVSLARLRIGHTRLTHNYLISPCILAPPSVHWTLLK